MHNPQSLQLPCSGINPTAMFPGAGKSWIFPWDSLPSAVQPPVPDVGHSTPPAGGVQRPPQRLGGNSSLGGWGQPGPSSTRAEGSSSKHPLQQRPGVKHSNVLGLVGGQKRVQKPKYPILNHKYGIKPFLGCFWGRNMFQKFKYPIFRNKHGNTPFLGWFGGRNVFQKPISRTSLEQLRSFPKACQTLPGGQGHTASNCARGGLSWIEGFGEKIFMGRFS